MSILLLISSFRGSREWLSLFAAIGTLALAVVAAFPRKGGTRSPLARPLACLFFVLFGWNFAVLAGHAARVHRLDSVDAFGALDAFFTALSPPLVFEVILVFVGETQRRRTPRLVAWIGFAVLAAIGLGGLASPALLRATDEAFWTTSFTLGWLATLAYGAIALIRYMNRAIDPQEKLRARIVLAALTIGGAFSTSDAVRSLGLPLPYLGALGTLVAAALLATLVVRLDLLEQSVSARMAIYVVAMTASFAVLYLVVLVAFTGRLAVQLFAACVITLLASAVVRELALSVAETRARTQRLAVLGRFSAQMTHDIRGPLTALLGAIDVLEEEADASTRTEFLALVAEQARRVATIVDRYDRMARIEPQRTLVRMDEIVRAVARAHGVAQVELATSEVDCDADRALIESALENVVRNAIEATNDPALVRIEGAANPRTGTFAIRVVDRGPGMDPRVVARAAEDFFTTKPNGSGLGLAFARRVLEAHGGSLLLHSKTGAGSTVELRFPLRPEP